MNEQEAIEVLAGMFRIARVEGALHKHADGKLDAMGALEELKSLGFVRQEVEWKDKPDSEGLWFGSYSGGRAAFLADILFKNSEEGFYKIIGTFCGDSFYSEHTDDAFYKSLNDKTCKNYKWTKAQVPEAPKEGE
jgi:hypothetical protein